MDDIKSSRNQVIKEWMYQRPYDSLEPYMDDTSFYIHYHKHHYGYATKLFDLLLEAYGDIYFTNIPTLENIIHEHGMESSIYFNAAQVWNHNFFWSGLSPFKDNNKIALINEQLYNYFSLDDLISIGCAHRGSGYLWVVYNKKSNHMECFSMDNAYIPDKKEYYPIFCIDLWEHSYYLKYYNNRKEYLLNTINHLLNHDFVLHNIAMRKINIET